MRTLLVFASVFALTLAQQIGKEQLVPKEPCMYYVTGDLTAKEKAAIGKVLIANAEKIAQHGISSTHVVAERFRPDNPNNPCHKERCVVLRFYDQRGDKIVEANYRMRINFTRKMAVSFRPH